MISSELLQRGKTAACRSKLVAIFLIVTFKPACAQAQNEASIADMIDCLRHISQQSRIAIGIARHQAAHFDPFRQSRHGRQKCPTLEMVALWVAIERKKVIPIPECIHAQRFEPTNGLYKSGVGRVLWLHLHANADTT